MKRIFLFLMLVLSAVGCSQKVDEQFGFRDVKLECSESEIPGLKSTRRETVFTIYQRTNEQLSLVGVPLDSIEYYFFSNKLALINVYWRTNDYKAGTTISEAMYQLLGKPATNTMDKVDSKNFFTLHFKYYWKGRKADAAINYDVVDHMDGKAESGGTVRFFSKGLWTKAIAAYEMPLPSKSYRNAKDGF